MLWGVASILLLCGAILLALSLRGRRIGEAPHCRRCGFDLTGIAPPADIPSAPAPPRCPECGRTLDRPRAVATGLRRGRPALALVGALVLLGGTGAAGLAISSSRTDLNSLKPTWLLMIEATRLRGAAREAAADELSARHAAAPLAPGQLGALVDAALDAQADANSRWLGSPWFDLLDAAFAAGAVSPGQESRYTAQAIGTLEIHAPAVALGGSHWETELFEISPRPISAPRVVPFAPIGFAAYLQQLSVDRETVTLEELGAGGRWFVHWGQYESVIHPNGSSLSGPRGAVAGMLPTAKRNLGFPRLTFEPGQHQLDFQWRIEGFRLAPIGSAVSPIVPDVKPSAAFTWNGSHHVRAGSTSADVVDVVRGIRDEQRTPRLFVDRDGGPGAMYAIPCAPGDNTRCDYVLTCPIGRFDTSDVWLVGRLVLRADGYEWPLSGNGLQPSEPGFEPACLISAPGRALRETTLHIDELPASHHVDLVLVPDIDEAAGRGIVGPVWDKEIVLRSIPLQAMGLPIASPSVRSRPEDDGDR
ncbi:MAG TPA: hypothetical protein VFF69_00510 [Phycisphaerales bacterium]|nr:hypothetical protein [Phycisphaerales bacterium]